MKPYWVNTGSSDLIRDLLSRAGSEIKQDLETLIQGGDLVKAVRDNTVLAEIQDNSESLWSFLLFSGYLKAVETWREEETTFCRLKIPNKEVRFVYNEIIQFWVNKGLQATDYRLMMKSLTEGDIETFGKIFRDVVKKSFSYFDVGGDEPEKFYHAFVLGMMVYLAGEYQLKSNRESGYGGWSQFNR